VRAHLRLDEDGVLHFLGRTDRQTKIRGYRVEPAEVEAQVCAHPAVRSAAVVAVPASSGGLRLVAYWVPRAPSDAAPAGDLAAWLGRRLPPHLVPSDVIAIPELPLTRNGKVDLGRLCDFTALVRPMTGPRPQDPRTAGAEPSSPTQPQARLVEIWRDVLEVEDIGVDDDYFALGGDSIAAIVVVARAKHAGITLSTHDLFELRTIRRLAEATDLTAAATPPASLELRLEALELRPGALELRPDALELRPDALELRPKAAAEPADHPLTPMQLGMLFHALADPGAYVVQVRARLDGDIDIAVLAETCQRLAERHSALRTSFRWDGATARQLLHPVVRVPVEVLDWRSHPAADVESDLARHLADDRRRGFDLTEPPLLRMSLIRLAEATVVFVLTHHHLVLDGWSQQLLMRELLDGYDNPIVTAVAPDASPPALARHAQRLADADLDSAERFWRARLSGHTLVPLAPDRPGHPDRRQSTVDVILPASRSAGLTAYSRRNAITLSTILYGGWALSLAALTGADDVTFGVTLAGRSPDVPGALDAIGMFINTLPLRLRIPSDGSLAQWLQQVQRDRSDLTRVEHTPLSLLGSWIGGADAARRRLFDTIAVIENFPVLVPVGRASARLRVSDISSDIDEGYPVVFEARPGPPVELRIRYDAAAVSSTTADDLLTMLGRFLDLVAGTSEQIPLADVATHLRDVVDQRRQADQRARRAAETTALRAARRQPVGERHE
jgi:nonribosomal peptide synthetase protein BlmV